MLNGKGSSEFRQQAFAGATLEITCVLNTRWWVFDDSARRYAIALTCVTRQSRGKRSILLRGPFASLESFITGVQQAAVSFTGDEVRGWTDTAALPLLPTEKSAEVFAQLRKAPRLDLDDGDSWRARPHYELHATDAKGLMALTEHPPEGY